MVLLVCNNTQVLNIIIRLISVDVVDAIITTSIVNVPIIIM